MTYLTVSDAARTLRVSEITVRRWIWSGKLPATRLGRVLRIRQGDLEQLGRDTARPAAGSLRPGSPAALLRAIEECRGIVSADDVEELEQVIAQACERPGEAGSPLA